MTARIEESRSELFERAHGLAFFLHPDPDLSFRIALEAVARLEVTAKRQTRRRSYLPVGRRRAGGVKAPGSRYRVSLERRQLLQLLVLIASEPFERDQEERPTELPDARDMAVRFVAYLVRICLGRNSFHTALGIGRVLHDYSTEDVTGLFDLLSQDPDRFPDADYLRERKRVLLEQLRQRFGAHVRTRRGRRGEERLEAQEPTARLAALVGRTLDACTPWGSECSLPERFDPLGEEIPALRFDAGDPDREHPVEVRRIHALLHPPCLERLTGALGLDAPARRLAVPRFFHVRAGDGGGERRPGSAPPSGSTLSGMSRELERRAARRAGLEVGWLSVRVDGGEVLRWHPVRQSRARLAIDPEAERVEIWAIEGGDETLLALYLVDHGGLVGQEGPASIRLEGGQSIGFALARAAGAGDRALTLEVSYRESRAGRAAALWLRRLAHRLGGPNADRPILRRPGAGRATLAGAAATLVLLLAVGVYLGRPTARPDATVVRGRQPPNVPLAVVESVHVEMPGDDAFDRRLQVLLVAELEARDGWSAAASRADAQAVLGPAGEEDTLGGRRALKLVGRGGEVLWQESFAGGAAEIAAAAVSDLDRARARSR